MRRLRPFLGPLFAAVDRFGVQTAGDRDRLVRLGIDPGRIVVTGNLKYNSPEPPASPELETALQMSPNDPLIYANLASAHAQLRQRDQTYRYIEAAERSAPRRLWGPACGKHVLVSTTREEYPPIADYGLIGDCHTAALVCRDGSIDWCCMPRFDSGSIFGRLLDRERGGFCAIEPSAKVQSIEREYLQDTLVLVTTFHLESGTPYDLALETAIPGGALRLWKHVGGSWVRVQNSSLTEIAHTANGAGWNKTLSVTLTVTASDAGSGLAGAPNCTDNTLSPLLLTGGSGTWTTSVSGEGRHVVDCSVSDNATNSQTASDTVKIDTVNPSGTPKIAVLDTGVDASHPDLAGQLVPGTDVLDGSAGTSDPNGHGTAMAGIVAALTDNNLGIAGIGYAGVARGTILLRSAPGSRLRVHPGHIWSATRDIASSKSAPLW